MMADSLRVDAAETSETADLSVGPVVCSSVECGSRHGDESRAINSPAEGAGSFPSPLTARSAQAPVDAMNDEALLAAKLEAMAEFAAGAGHEINNPLAAISGRAQLLLRDETDPERRRHLLTIGAQALRIRDMIGDAMLFARPPQPEPVDVDLLAAIELVLSRFTDELESRRLSITGKRAPATQLRADETQLHVVLSELLRNAIWFSPEGCTIRIDVDQPSNDFVRMAIADKGPGLSETDREHLFDPFFSGRQAGRGLGFGLPKCWRIVTLHGGRITAEESADGGFSIVVHWPIPKPEGHSDSGDGVASAAE